jgi:hypothetical protein
MILQKKWTNGRIAVIAADRSDILDLYRYRQLMPFDFGL